MQRTWSSAGSCFLTSAGIWSAGKRRSSSWSGVKGIMGSRVLGRLVGMLGWSMWERTRARTTETKAETGEWMRWRREWEWTALRQLGPRYERVTRPQIWLSGTRLWLSVRGYRRTGPAAGLSSPPMAMSATTLRSPASASLLHRSGFICKYTKETL